MNLQELAAVLGQARREGREWRCLCPAHADHNPSLSITEKNGKLCFVCRAGCSQDAVLSALAVRGLWGQPGRDKPQIETTYDYVDETGRLLFQVVRMRPKTFRQRRPDGAGWVWDLQGVRRVLYRFDELVAAAKKRNGRAPRIFVPEGEKDVDTLNGRWGLTATTNPGGAGKWRDE